MASTSTGGSYPTLIPTLGADANVMDALYFYHFGNDPYTGATNANSIAGHIAAVIQELTVLQQILAIQESHQYRPQFIQD